MPPPLIRKGALQLLESLDLRAVQERSLEKLHQLLSQSDAVADSLQNLRTESESLVQKVRGKLDQFLSRITPAESRGAPEYKVFRRETPVFSTRIPASVPEWANGAKPAQTIGPIQGIDGREFWFDFYLYEKLIPVYLSGNPAPVMLLPLKLSLFGGSSTEYSLGSGSIWMRADLFAGGLSANQYAGVNITGGKLKFSSAQKIQSNSITIPASVSFNLKLDLNNTFAASGSLPEGIDARESTISLPKNAEFQFAAAKFSLLQLGESKWKLYGDTRTFKKLDGPVVYNDFLKRLSFPLSTDQPEFIPSVCKSAFYKIAGKAKVAGSGWCLNVGVLDVTKPFAVGNNGAIAIACTEGLHYRWKGLNGTQDVKMKTALVMAEPGKFSVADFKAQFKFHTEDYRLWKRDDSDIRTSVSLGLKKDKPFIYYCDEAGTEMLSAFADADFQTEKPYKANGESVSPRTLDSLYIKYVSLGKKGMFVYDLDMVQEMTPDFKHLKKPEIYQFAIKNAYIVTTPPISILLAGSYNDDNSMQKGKLYISYGMFTLTPTLPHPYTANVLLKDTGFDVEALKNVQDVKQWASLIQNFLMSSCAWKDGGVAEVDFDLLTELFNSLSPDSTAGSAAVLPESNPLTEFESIADGRHALKNGYSLLDISTGYDLFGISLAWSNRRTQGTRNGVAVTGANGAVTIEKMNLQAPMALLKAFTLPDVSWEPLNNLSEGLSVDPPQGIISFPNNGVPSVFSFPDPKPVDIDPASYMDRFAASVSGPANKLSGNVIFNLPHAKISMAVLKYFDPKHATVLGNLSFIQPAFKSGKFIGGRQFRIASSKESGRHKLTGITTQLKGIVDSSGDTKDISILGDSVHEIFQNDFYEDNANNPVIRPDGVPITHIDLSGYGASTFSDWLNPDAQIAQTSKVRFDVMVGRVAHEVVQVVSLIYPWGIKVVRTITFHRNANAVIYREDSGWVAQSEGLFDFSFHGRMPDDTEKAFDNPYSFHPGLIGGLFKVHNIKELEEKIEIPYTLAAGDYQMTVDKKINTSPAGSEVAVFRAVTFDADVALEDATGPKNEGKIVGKSFKGFVQVAPQGVPVPARVLAELFSRQQNSIDGSVDNVMRIGGSDQLLKVNRIDASASHKDDNPNNHVFVIAAKGSIQLPAQGSWSLVEVDKGSGVVSPVSNKDSVPVIRAGERDRTGKAFSIIGQDKFVKVAFADALANNVSFKKRFAYLQNTGTQKLLLTDPKIDKNLVKKVLNTDPGLLADAYRLLNSKGPFPNLADAITIENATATLTNIVADGLDKQFPALTVPDNMSFDIIGKDGDTLHMYIQYESAPTSGGKTKSIIKYVTESSADSLKKGFANTMNNISIAVDMGPFKKLLTVSGDFKAETSANPSMDSGNSAQLRLCKELQPIVDILEFLANLDPSNAVESIQKGLKIAMSNSADSWEYKFKAEKEIPVVRFPFDAINYNSPTTPLKLDAYFRIGCYYNQPIKIPETVNQLMPSAGAYLELGADLRVMCFSLAAATVYATGRAQVGLAADIKSGPNLYFKFGFGIELCVGLPVIGSVSVMYLVGVDMRLTTETLTVGAFMYFRGRAEIFGGIVTITIQIEAAGKIQKQLGGGPCNCQAMCTFALDISIFLVINISFTETWEESRQIA